MQDRMTDFFVAEAGEYLEQLEALCAEAVGQSPELGALRRLTRALRGTARLHEFALIAEIAERLERLTVGMTEGRIDWTTEMEQRLGQTLADLKVLVPGVRAWDATLEARAREARDRWADLGAGEPGRAEDAGDEAEVVRFVTSELEGISQTVSDAVSRLASSPGDQDALRSVLRRLNPLAGAAWLESFASVSELVHGVDEVTRVALARGQAVARESVEFLRAAAKVAAETAAAVAEQGAESILASTRELRERAAAVTHSTGAGSEVVPVESLFFDDEGPHIVSYGGVERGEDEEVPLEVRNFFLIEATSLIDRAQGLLERVREGRAGGAQDLGTTCEELARTFGWFQFADTARVVRNLAERAPALATDTAQGGPFRQALAELRSIVERIDQPAEVSTRTQRIHSLLSVAPARQAPPPPVAEVAPAEAREHVPGVVGEITTETAEPVLAGAVAEGVAEDDEVVPIGDLLYTGDAAVAEDGEVVPIGDLLYTGDAALRRALEIKPDADAALARGDLIELAARLSEIYDLLQQAQLYR